MQKTSGKASSHPQVVKSNNGNVWREFNGYSIEKNMKYTRENYTYLFIYIPTGQRIPSGRLSPLPSKYIPALI